MLESAQMSVEAPPAPYSARRDPIVREDYELDLRAFFAVLWRQAPFIFAAIGLALLAAALYVYVQPRTYDGVSKIIITRPKQQLGFEPKLITNYADFELRPFYTHAKHPDVERAVQDKLRSQLTESERQSGALVQRLQTKSARDDTALMELHFAHPDPHLAAVVANAWSEAYLRHAREALNPNVQSQRQVEAQMKEVLAELQRREDTVRAFQQRTGLGITPSADNVRIDVGAAALPGASAVQSASLPLTMRTGARGRELAAKSAQIAELRAQRDGVRLLRAQVVALRAAGVGIESLSAELDKLGVPRTASAETTLDARERALTEAADRSSVDLRALETTLSEELGQLERLERDRDIARDAYVALARKTEENKVALAADWPVVQLFQASPDPAGAEPRPWLLALGPAFAGGLLVGVLGAFWLDRRRAATRGLRLAPSIR